MRQLAVKDDCYEDEWLNAEKQASYDYKTGNFKSAPGIDEMFEKIENSGNGNIMPSDKSPG
jgi:hypothetical protein